MNTPLLRGSVNEAFNEVIRGVSDTMKTHPEHIMTANAVMISFPAPERGEFLI